MAKNYDKNYVRMSWRKNRYTSAQNSILKYRLFGNNDENAVEK